jgi:aminoglycoside phosphotransferase (APT) family kinase protein
MLDATSIGPYLRARGLISAQAEVTATPMGGGISNGVLLVETDRGDRLVIKQARDRLDVSAEWHIDRRRAINEAHCLRYLEEILPAGSVPRVMFTDEAESLIGMTVAPRGGVIWKQQLLGGHVSRVTARRVGQLLATIHATSADDPRIVRDFDNHDLLEQGRIDPYHRAAAAVHPRLAAAIGAEIERLETTRRTLVLGDVSPKNVFVYPDRVLFFDVEIADWGDPAFDVAFCLTHLILKALLLGEHRQSLLAAATSLWNSYLTGVPAWPDFHADVLAELGCLLLARVDGKSPVEYLHTDDERDVVRSLAESLLSEPPSSITMLLDDLRHREPTQPNRSAA